ncbi:DUF58 domain-containing protein [Kibdelosporangium phytohabitans]|uniref:DUF58 domain-containing protein n=1 Tax=Kibdelosporangium phytohabitans TaxID=860235 RepID=A0A0N9HYQ9_9PSEU|nr:DUF58 domain-containing protein [Kibdelosporangium phytohabitans]ALG07030.1 hypothetical protein AOZ06_08890 [Kibdelosporangium phytohabitans]MBE1468321.1 uncharacterized protein (DUF58 family) [Kibdelosporangium phytohabitans]
MRLTQRGTAMLVAAPVLLVSGWLAGFPVLIVLGAIAFCTVVAAVAVAGRKPRVAVVRDVHPDRVERGSRAGIVLRVRNPGARWQSAFTAVDRLGASTLRIAVRPLAPGAEQAYLNELPTWQRGKHEVGPLTLRRTDALGLGENTLFIGETATLWVYPRTLPVRSAASGLPLHHHDGAADETSPRGSLDIREVREYVPGDEVRHLHWKATARTGKLMIRDYADPRQPQFTVLLDNRPQIAAAPEFEEAVDVAASLVVAAAKADNRCQLATPSGVDVITTPGAVAVQRLLDELCVLDRTTETDLPLVPRALAQSWGGQFVVISSAVSAADQAALARVRSRYADLVVIALGNRDAAVAGGKVLRAADAVDATRQWQTVIAR